MFSTESDYMAENCLLPVKSKINCIYEIKVIEENDKSLLKRPDQTYIIRASEILLNSFKNFISNNKFIATEKVDGTSTLVKSYGGSAWLWVRRDRKLTKQAVKRKKLNNEIVFKLEDYKEAPSTWEASESCVNADTGELIPDITGNIMGWLPLNNDKLYFWHREAVEFQNKKILVLNPYFENKVLKFQLSMDALEIHHNKSFELIGTNVNANPYKLGSKKCPIHFFIQHGSIPILNPIYDFSHNSMIQWFNNKDIGSLEGIVWHCNNQQIYKLTRKHLNLEWPVEDPLLIKIPVKINLSSEIDNMYINKLLQFNGQSFDSLEEFSKKFVSKFT